MTSSLHSLDDRILILAPTANDSPVAVEVLRSHGFAATACSGIHDLCAKIEEGCCTVVLAQEALTIESAAVLTTTLRHQEPWSDLPVVLLTAERAERTLDIFSSSGNISILERPFSRAELLSAIEVAVRARQKQYLAKQMLEEQKQAAVRRDEFLATLSHELRTPLNVILGWTEILLAGDLSREAQVEALQILDRNARVQKSLIDDLLDTSRIITGKLYLELRPVSLKQTLKSIHLEYLPRTREKGLDFSISLPERDAVVYADDSRLPQVFTNLVTNAIKFTPRGGSISISLTRVGRVFEVKVSDTGQGMDAAFLPQVFDRLKQEDMSITRAHGGLGLGLSITSHIVQEHHGEIRAHSAGRNKGSEFTVVFPVYEAQGFALKKPKPSSGTQSLEGVKILVIDDSADIRQLIQLWLKKAKADVKVAASGQEGLDELRKDLPDVILSDIGMPGMDGYEFIQRVRADSAKAIASIPAAALTAYAKDEERARAIAVGFQAHISKPINNERLIAAVSALVRT